MLSVCSPAVEILFVCTGNTCRSPMAAVLFDARVRELGLEAAVSSAGLLYNDRPATDHGIAVMAARGLDTSTHRSRRLTPDLARQADLVVGLAREHVREAVAAFPGAWGRTFTLKELVRRGEQLGPRRADQDLAQWLAGLHEGRRTSDLMGASPDDDVADPIGQPRPAYEATAVELEDLTARLARLVTGSG